MKNRIQDLRLPSLAVLALGIVFLSGCAVIDESQPGTPPPEPTVPLYDRDDLIKEPEPPKIPLKDETEDGESDLKKTGPDEPLYKRPDA